MGIRQGESQEKNKYPSIAETVIDAIRDKFDKRGERKNYAIGGVGGFNPFSKVATVEKYTPEGWPFAVSPQCKLAVTWGKIKRR
ncbi:TPA: hypothetical protein EYP66_16055 [Candidatus Poribacteria bacterium]|nr:hypothetical protein [Candidatus Poribacteria bacterium]